MNQIEKKRIFYGFLLVALSMVLYISKVVWKPGSSGAGISKQVTK